MEGTSCRRLATIAAATACSLISGLATTPIEAEPPGMIGDEYLFDSWQRQQGLPQISVTSVVQDRRGYLWVGTEDGLARFDGQRFRVLDRLNTPQLPSNAIRALLPDRDGSLWIATRRGLALWHSDQLTVFTTAEGLIDDDVRCLVQGADGSLWIGTASGLGRRRSDGIFTAYTEDHGLPHRTVAALAEDRDGVLWIGTEDGLGRFKDEQFSTALTVADGLVHPHIRALYEDQPGNLWIGTDGGLQRLRAGSLDRTFTVADGLGHPVVSAFGEDADGQLWIGTDGGLSRLGSDGLKAYGLQTPAGTPGNRVRALWRDHENSLWVGTGLLGLLRLRRSQITVLGSPEGLIDDLVWVTYQDRSGAVWIGTNIGLSRIDQDGSMSHYTVADGLPGADVRSLLEDREGNLWIGTETDGLARLRDGKIATLKNVHGLAGKGIFTMLEDAHGDLWFGTEAGLSRWRDGRFETFTTTEGLSHDRVWSLYQDSSSTLWIGTDSGLTRWTGEQLEAVPLPSPDIAKTITGEADGTLWIGTAENGLLRYRDGHFDVFSVDDGLFDHLIHRILDDGQGWLWMSSNQGLFRVQKSQLEDFAAGRVERLRSISYSEEQGMRSRECNGGGEPAGIRTRDGRLWFPTIQGVSIVDPQRQDLNEVAPPVHLERVLVDNQAVDLGAAPVELPPRARELDLRYVALSFRDADNVSYRYQLRGFDRDWVDAGGRRSAHYTNLAPGKYTFQVIAANSDGKWNAEGDTLEIRVLPAFYQTWSFYVLCAAIALLLGPSIHWFRVRQLVRRNRVLLQTKAELELKNAESRAKSAEMERFTYAVSHDLKSPLVTVRGFLGMIRKDLAQGRLDRAEKDLERIYTATSRMQRLIDELLELSRIGRVVSEPREVSMFELAWEAADAVSGRIGERGVELDVDAGMPPVFGDRQRLLEVLQNLIDNAVKFLDEQPHPWVHVGWRRDGDETIYFVADNGRGIAPRYHEQVFGLFERLDPDVEGTGIGLAMVRRIVELHGGRIWVESQGDGQGSTFCFTLPAGRVQP